MRIVTLNELNFPTALPTFDPSFTLHRCFQRVVTFEPHEAIDPIFGGKLGSRFDLVLPHSPDEIRGRTDVQGAVRLTGQQVTKNIDAASVWVPAFAGTAGS